MYIVGKFIKMLYRRHRGSLNEAIKNLVEFNTEEDLFHIVQKDYEGLVEIARIEFGGYIYDQRIDWHTYQVIAHFTKPKKSTSIVGFVNGLPDD